MIKKRSGALCLLIGCIFLLTGFLSKKRYFEGAIVYSHTITCADASRLKNLQLTFGSKSDFYFKEGSYMQLNNGKVIISIVKDARENKTYYEIAHSDSIEYTDNSERDFEVLKSETSDSAFTVLSYPCTKTILTVKNLRSQEISETAYYCSKEMKVDPKWFEKSLKGFEYEKFKTIRSIPLKIIVMKKNYTMVMEAMEVKKEKLDSLRFTNVSNKPLKLTH